MLFLLYFWFRMRGNFKAYSMFSRSAWFFMAVLLLVLCGPVKRLIELQHLKHSTTAYVPEESKLKTGYREKREIVPLVQSVIHVSPDTDPTTFFLAPALLLTFALLFMYGRHRAGDNLHLQPAVVTSVPLFLRHRKILV